MALILGEGIKMPGICLGKYRVTNHDLLLKIIDYSLHAGYILYDTGVGDDRERFIRNFFRNLLSEYDDTRDDIFRSTKLAPHSCGGKFVPSEFEGSLDDVGQEYVDMYLVLFPGSAFSVKYQRRHPKLRRETWLALARVYDESKINAICVNNFTVDHLMQISDVMAIGPMVDQNIWRPYYSQIEMLQHCCDHNIRIQAYSSFAGLSRRNLVLMEEPEVRAVARKRRATSAQVLLVWALQKGVAVIPDSSTKLYPIYKNEEFHLRLSKNDIARLDKLSVKNLKYSWGPTLVA